MAEGRARVGVGDDLAYKLRSEPNQFSQTSARYDAKSLNFLRRASEHASVRTKTSCVTEAVATGFGGDKSGTVNPRIGGDK